MPRKSLLQRPFSIHRDLHDASPVPVVTDAASSSRAVADAAADAAPDLDAPLSLAKTLTPRAVNSMHGRHALARFDGSESSPDSRRSSFASSVNSTASASSTMAASIHDRSSPAVRLKDDPVHDAPAKRAAKSVRSPDLNGAAAVSAGLGLHSTSNNIHDSSLLSDAADHDSGHWDSTIGKAGLGKTGRVIKLVSDNDALKRDIPDRALARQRGQAGRPSHRRQDGTHHRRLREPPARGLRHQDAPHPQRAPGRDASCHRRG